MLVVLSAIAATTALFSQQLTLSRAANAVPGEGFYWSVAQYQIAHHRLKQELRAVAAGEPVNAQELSRRAAVVASRGSILSEPSEIKSLLNGVPGYAEATHRVAELQRRAVPILETKPFGQAEATAVLGLFQAAGDEELLSQLASDVRLAEITAMDDMTQTLTRRIWWAWGGFAFCWFALALWLFYAIRSRRRYRAAAHDRKRAVEAMELANASKRKFLSMVNHEVRSPLQSIVASAEFLAMKDSRADSAGAIRRIRHAVTVLQGQLRDLLTIARGDAAALPTQVETFELSELVQDVCAGLEEAALAKGLAFHIAFLSPPVTVSADPIRIAQVLRNLVENSVRYTSAGHVRVRVEPFVSQASAAGAAASTPETHRAGASDPASPSGLIRFVVHDTGPGLPHAALERLRSAAVPFASSDDGTGIGLFVIRDVLQQLGGRIDVQSRDAADPDGQGTTFTVCIPAQQVTRSLPEDDLFEGSEALNVLVVDDLADVRESLAEVTRRLGHACHVAGSAAEAGPLLASTHFDVALIDLEMPGTDGLALATEIREGGGPSSGAMLILISAAENQAAGQVWPFDGFLQKPIDGQALARLIGSPA
ncbi:MAG: hybrid sensor histidine kinase/response regulator [Aquabacterium sp.]|nr:hybrid sensor histidine kinase/response regulator [Aquabacterium sp.]